MDENNRLEVLYVEPGKVPRFVQIDDSLESMQDLVGGMIEEYMPFEDDVAVICNEEGKFNGMELNRAIYSQDGQLMDIIAGAFFVCYAPLESESFLTLPDNLKKKYAEKFKSPERFGRDIKGDIVVKKIHPGEKEMER